MGTTTAVFDADFIQTIASVQTTPPSELFDKLTSDLDCNPVVHPFVAEEELLACELAKNKISEGLLRVVAYSEFIKTEFQKQHYIQTFLDAYRWLTLQESGKEEAPPTDDIFHHFSGYDFGEIHSVLMAAELEIPLFYSNDHSSKSLCGRFSDGVVKSYRMTEVCQQLAERETSSVTSRERKALLSGYGRSR